MPKDAAGREPGAPGYEKPKGGAATKKPDGKKGEKGAAGKGGNALTKKYGPLPLWAWAAITGGVFYFVFRGSLGGVGGGSKAGSALSGVGGGGSGGGAGGADPGVIGTGGGAVGASGTPSTTTAPIVNTPAKPVAVAPPLNTKIPAPPFQFAGLPPGVFPTAPVVIPITKTTTAPLVVSSTTSTSNNAPVVSPSIQKWIDSQPTVAGTDNFLTPGDTGGGAGPNTGPTQTAPTPTPTVQGTDTFLTADSTPSDATPPADVSAGGAPGGDTTAPVLSA